MKDKKREEKKIEDTSKQIRNLGREDLPWFMQNVPSLRGRLGAPSALLILAVPWSRFFTSIIIYSFLVRVIYCIFWCCVL